MSQIKILWADDEIDLLKPQMMFLEQKGYSVNTVTNGYDALEELEKQNDIDVIFLDESMPGMTGLETLGKIKAIQPNVPVVMITKNEAEDIMEEAIGSQIDDYLIKPVNPNQILLSLKKIIDNKRLVREKTSLDYQQEFRKILMDIQDNPTLDEWREIYNKIIGWELKLGQSESEGMQEILEMQKQQANVEFSKIVKKRYLDWLERAEEGELTMSHNLMRRKIFPHLKDEKPVVVVLLDNLRYDQWKIIEPRLSELYRIEEEDYFISILPTTTQYSRNSIFAGMMPGDIARHFPDFWLDDHEEGGKNKYEGELLASQLKRLIREPVKHKYTKIIRVQQAKQLQEQALDYVNYDLSVIVYNFIDMLSHSRTEMEVLKELAGDEKAYRSLTASWFEHSPLWSALQKLAERDINLIITTDHGTIRVNQPSRVVGDKLTTTNLRYKMGRNLQYDEGDVLEIVDPPKAGLPKPNISSRFIFALEDRFFLYPNNYNYYHSYYMNTFQHGGVSLEEMICPVVHLTPR
jgi:CheY-like chemotaxis protein